MNLGKPKTFDRAELQGQELLLMALKRWADCALVPDLSVSFHRLDVRRVHKTLPHTASRITNIEFKGLMTIGTEELRFECAFPEYYLVWHVGEWVFDDRLTLSLPGTDISGTINYIEFFSRIGPRGWQISSLLAPSMDRVAAALTERLFLET